VDCKQCDKVLEELENIDDEADSAGIDFVKIDDKDFARKMGVFALPAVVFFRHGHLDPVIYAGDLKNEERLLEWLLIQKDPTSDMIEEYDDEALVEVIRKQEFVAVYFCNNSNLLTTDNINLTLKIVHFIDHFQTASKSVSNALPFWTN
jgi:thiol-disulfide isomerase/thioredoxin